MSIARKCYPFPAYNFSKYKMNVIPKKECILIIDKFELNMHSLFGITFILYKKILLTVTLMYCDGAKSNCFTKHRVFLAMVECYSFWASQFFKNVKVS